jgi:UDP-glucose 4-epimerase
MDGQIEILRADIEDASAVARAVEESCPRFVFHLAAPPDTPASLRDDGRFYRSIVIGTLHLLQALEKSKVESIVLAGSAKEYGGGDPFSEEQATSPATPYAVAKLAATLMGRMYHRSHGLPISSLRLFPTYGPGQGQGNLIPDCIRAALRGEALRLTAGEQAREFHYVEDVIEGFVAAASRKLQGDVINLCSGDELTVREVVSQIYELADCSVLPLFGALPYRGGETWHFRGDPTRCRERLGWKPRILLRDGLMKTIEADRKSLCR